MCQHMPPSKVPLTVGDLDPHTWFLDPLESGPQMASGLFKPFCTARPCAQHVSVCLSHHHTHRYSPGGSMRHGQHTFWPDSKEDQRACMMMMMMRHLTIWHIGNTSVSFTLLWTWPVLCWISISISCTSHWKQLSLAILCGSVQWVPANAETDTSRDKMLHYLHVCVCVVSLNMPSVWLKAEKSCTPWARVT